MVMKISFITTAVSEFSGITKLTMRFSHRLNSR